MGPLPGFSNNPFASHADFKVACIALLRALQPYQSPGGARIKLPLATGTHFDDIAAQLEGFARPLWAVGALLHGQSMTEDEIETIAQPYVRGLANGTDPSHPEYWGPVVVRDQRMVEMEIVSFALLSAPGPFFYDQSKEARDNITNWLDTLNGKDFPTTNWLWFRVMTNLALVIVCGIPYAELKEAMDEDLDQMEKFDRGNGWSADGIWNENGRQADYYSGSFAIQFSQLLYIKMASHIDPKRCERFRQRAVEFGLSFLRYFDDNGAAIPFGRSLTYRFAFAGFWSAVAFAEIDLPAPLDDWGVIKGLLLRHLRWWGDKNDMFNIDGTLTIGFAFPNMYLSEDYNSPQSPYWAMKTFIALGQFDTHPFWTAKEKPLPEVNTISMALESPMHILCSTGNHHFLLSAGQFCPWPLKATEAKYGKFAYSSHFAFSVPSGSSVMAQIAPDSTMALSKDGGDTWRVPWKLQDIHIDPEGAQLLHSHRGNVESIPTLTSRWKPWRDCDIVVSTVLVAPCSRWPDWYLRVHQIENTSSAAVQQDIKVTQGGFAIQGRKAEDGGPLSTFQDERCFLWHEKDKFKEGTLHAPGTGVLCSDAGTSGIRALEIAACEVHQTPPKEIEGGILKPDANTNLIWQRTLIPVLTHEIHSLKAGEKTILATGVFAVKRNGPGTSYERLDLEHRWQDAPIVTTGRSDEEYFIVVELPK
ncbi:hypothetical protein EJ04DRAFT_552452 [Polyplosphaeria fusca]|uniref:DUF2264 domain-containing protein n=1 Tax=Polyplosphaeria fusca TaxID=682080 RepID=A0A9P4R172_9PLEO|nr:hypothetical protein EJ04DRAFT_552452 [Polyplosphaeria fusca]